MTGGPAAGGGTGGADQYDAVRIAPPSARRRTRARRRTTGCTTSSTTRGEGPGGPAGVQEGPRAEIEDKKIRQGPDTRSSRSSRARSSSRPRGASGGKSTAPSTSSSATSRRSAARSIKNPEQNFDNGPGGSGARTSRSTSPTRARRSGRTRRARSRSAAGELLRRQPAERVPALRDRAGQRDHLGAVHRLPAEPGRHRRRRTARRSPAASRSSPPQNLANLLKTGALPIKLELISSSQVSATLGKQALNQGLLAGIVGLLAGLALPADLVPRRSASSPSSPWASTRSSCSRSVKPIPITLTLPGIAGLILTIGVAADANIVIFERVKEEIRAADPADRDQQGYKKGLTAIIDANVVTFMVAFILFILATAGREGLRVHARRRHPRLVPHRGAAHPGGPRHARALADRHAPGRARRGVHAPALPLGLHGQARSASSRCPA